MISAVRATRCLYHYDPLDRLARSTPAGRAGVKCFYRKNRLTTHIQGQITRTLLHADGLLLAQQHHDDQTVDCALLATDQQGSTLATPQSGFSYTPYGSRHPQTNAMNLPAFTGQQADEMTGHYPLGNGYRAFNPILMRFNSPDSFSPFGEGGLNAYAYCAGDPVNRVDPSGRTPTALKSILRFIGAMKRPPNAADARMRNFKVIADDAYTFEDVVNGQPRLNISSHGTVPEPGKPAKLAIQNKAWSAEQIHNVLKGKGYTFDDYENIRVIACFSASGDAHSFAAQFARLTQKPVTGFKSLVSDNRSIERTSKIIRQMKSQYSHQSEKHIARYYAKRKQRILRPTDKTEIVEFSPDRLSDRVALPPA
ncbi:RHS repeat-associated core domain-containing protein [Pseudomonas syringae]|uniref:RHS repeat-associated core domain-containing protein n=1 Tax=Pseudomonas syringae TaxID=317 RepID=UPI001F3471FE|nr:RHS repeat-associated core domain-containing protein [Pseudomonas syringae]